MVTVGALGALVSTVFPISAESEIPPSGLVNVATTLYSPSGKGLGTSTEYVPPFTIAVTVCVPPFTSVIVKVITVPSGASVVPIIVGVLSFVISGASTVSVYIIGSGTSFVVTGAGVSEPPPPPAAAPIPAAPTRAPSNPSVEIPVSTQKGVTKLSPPSAWPA